MEDRTESLAASEVEPVSPGSEKTSSPGSEKTSSADGRQRPSARQKALLAGGAIVVVVVVAISIAVAVDQGSHNAQGPRGAIDENGEVVFPFPDDPDYDPFAKIGDNSSIAIADIDQFLGYFTSSDITREALTEALSQANQTEVDRIFEVIGNYDSSDNVEVTNILNKYGLETSEVPMDIMGHISENSDFTEGEVNELAFNGYPGIPFTDIRNSLADFSQEEIDIARKVMDGHEAKSVLNNLLQGHGVELPSGY